MDFEVSKYTFFLEIKGAYFLYNTLSNSLVEIDGELFDLLKNNSKIKSEDIGGDVIEDLLKRDFLVENQIDSFLKYKSLIHHMRSEYKFMHLTIAPTMDCCFDCHYCFEKNKSKVYISEQIMDDIIKYIKSIETLQSIKLTWFGGEPLMAVEQIEQFYDKFSVYWKDKSFSSNIITTGYHLNEKVIRKLQKVKISSAQITIDGLRDTHNSIKRLPNNEDVFEKIMCNIELMNDLAPEIEIVIRVNLTKKNSQEYIELNKYLKDRFFNRKKISWAPAFVMNRGSFTNEKEISDLFNRKSMADFSLKLWKEHHIKSQFINYPHRFFDECAIRNDLAISFDPEGYAYKCWEIIGNKKYSIGKIEQGGKIKNIDEKNLNRQLCGGDPLDDPVCSNCRFLPICNGGCPIQRLENIFENKHNDCCSIYKNNLMDVLRIHIEHFMGKPKT